MHNEIFEKSKPVIGVLQLFPLPGSLGWDGRINHVIARAEQEATALATGGVDAILVENTSDIPYGNERMDPAGAIAMGLIIRRIMHFTNIPVGVSVLRNDPETALAIAMNVGARFIRVNLLTGAAICESGILEGKYHQLAAYRHRLRVEGIAVYADISLGRALPMASDAMSSIMTMQSLARQAIDPGGADGIILADRTISAEKIREIACNLDLPVLYDYHHELSEVNPYLEAADGLVVSSVIKKSSLISEDVRPTVDLTKVEELVAVAGIVRQGASSALK